MVALSAQRLRASSMARYHTSCKRGLSTIAFFNKASLPEKLVQDNTTTDQTASLILPYRIAMVEMSQTSSHQSQPLLSKHQSSPSTSVRHTSPAPSLCQMEGGYSVVGNVEGGHLREDLRQARLLV